MYAILYSEDTLQVLGAWGPPQAHIDLVNVRHRVGFGRRLSCQLTVLAVSDWKLSYEELPSVQCFLEPLIKLRVVWEGNTSYKGEVHNAVGTKMQAAEVQRFDIVQCAAVWTSRARTEGVEYGVPIGGYLAGFRQRQAAHSSFQSWRRRSSVSCHNRLKCSDRNWHTIGIV